MTDLPALVADERSDLALASDPGAYMEAMLGRAVMWLGEVEQLEDVIHQKCATEAIATFIREKELGHDAELAAVEIVRRCERRIGQLVRQGQERGEIRTQADNHRPGVDNRDPDVRQTKQSPTGIFGTTQERRDVYSMTDGVTDEQFEEVIAEAKAEDNISRANVVRKIKGTPAPASDRSEYNYRKRRINPDEVVARTAMMLDGLVSSLSEIDVSALDEATVKTWAGPMKQHLTTLNRFLKEMTRHAGSHGDQ